jgi:hypothetical protein
MSYDNPPTQHPHPQGGYRPPPPAPGEPWSQGGYQPQYQPGPQQFQYQPAPQQLGSGLQVTAIVAGIFGVVFGFIPITFFLAWAFGAVALVVGVMAYRRAKAVGRKQGRAGIVMGAIAIVFGIIGVVIVSDAFDDLDEDLTCLDEADTQAEIDACNE